MPLLRVWPCFYLFQLHIKSQKMKTFKIFMAIAMVLFSATITNAQSNKLERIPAGIKVQAIHVNGECSIDKKRIETAAYSVDGVKSAVWDEYAQVLTLKYSVFKKDVADSVQKRIATVGNDTERYRADDAAYNKLPDCCHYQRKQS